MIELRKQKIINNTNYQNNLHMYVVFGESQSVCRAAATVLVAPLGTDAAAPMVVMGEKS
jgi:hypothetical protein